MTEVDLTHDTETSVTAGERELIAGCQWPSPLYAVPGHWPGLEAMVPCVVLTRGRLVGHAQG